MLLNEIENIIFFNENKINSKRTFFSNGPETRKIGCSTSLIPLVMTMYHNYSLVHITVSLTNIKNLKKKCVVYIY